MINVSKDAVISSLFVGSVTYKSSNKDNDIFIMMCKSLLDADDAVILQAVLMCSIYTDIMELEALAMQKLQMKGMFIESDYKKFHSINTDYEYATAGAEFMIKNNIDAGAGMEEFENLSFSLT